MENIRAATESFEKWLASQTTIVRKDVAFKHERLCDSPFAFLRGTFYRWIERWTDVCGPLTGSPRILSVGDLHVENFGTWRDVEGRLVWGVNDVDEATILPYANDLVRLATSAGLAVRECHLRLPLRDICDSILDGYTASLDRGGQPVVIAERRRWLHDVAISDLRDPKKFWAGMRALPTASRRVPDEAIRALETLMPETRIEYSVRRRIAGVGSLGRQRFVALADWRGGLIAREAKAYVVSAASRLGTFGSSRVAAAGQGGAARQLIESAVRVRDPFWGIHGSWIVRRLAPDCSRIEIEDLPAKRNERKLLRAMGWETANMHLATPRACPSILRDVRGRRPRWLERAASDMADSVIADWRAWTAEERG